MSQFRTAPFPAVFLHVHIFNMFSASSYFFRVPEHFTTDYDQHHCYGVPWLLRTENIAGGAQVSPRSTGGVEENMNESISGQE